MDELAEDDTVPEEQDEVVRPGVRLCGGMVGGDKLPAVEPGQAVPPQRLTPLLAHVAAAVLRTLYTAVQVRRPAPTACTQPAANRSCPALPCSDESVGFR